MRVGFSVFAAAALAVLVTGCAKPPAREMENHLNQPMPPRSASVPVAARLQAMGIEQQTDPVSTASISPRFTSGHLAGRTLQVGSVADLGQLRQGEVILTFDDGPSPTYTPQILAALADHKVKATFFMVGSMARAHPQTAIAVAKAGHSIGTHSHNHENLASLDSDVAMRAIERGETEVAKAIAPSGKTLAPFFRFPYLAQTRVLRTGLHDVGLIDFGVDVDSLDFKKDSADVVLQRTLDRLDRAGGGIVLFHDIHARTAHLLPDFLDALAERGYQVVNAVPAQNGVFGRELTIALRDDNIQTQ